MDSTKRVICVIVTLLTLELATGETLPVLEEGDPCTTSAPCPKHNGLTCQYGFCRCPMTMAYENSECLIRAGQKCDSSKIGICVQNSLCSNWKNECTCKNGYIADLNGTCSPEKNYGESCSFDDDCATRNKTLLCIDGICQCDLKVSKYKASRRNSWREDQGAGCVGLATKPCLHGLCVENSECSSGNEKICECRYNYKVTPQNTCVGVSGAHCPCAEGFICVDNICRCALGPLQYYNQEQRTCSSYVGSPCNDDDLRCLGSAVCVKKGSRENLGICNCPEGSVETIGGKCELSYGSSCNKSLTDGVGIQCDALASLYCKNGTCGCIDGSIYEESERRCAMPAGFRCDDKEASKVYCVANAECVKIHPKIHGRCLCKEGFVNTPMDTCEIAVEYFSISDNDL